MSFITHSTSSLFAGTPDDSNRILSTQCQNKTDLLNECGICKGINDQHLLAKCDTCHLHYHLGCLNPPLTRHPKKSKIYGWQCSECDEDNPDGVVQLTTGPRKSRTKYSKDGTIVPVDSSRDVSLDGSADDEKTHEKKRKVDETPATPVAILNDEQHQQQQCENNSMTKIDDKTKTKTSNSVKSLIVPKSPPLVSPVKKPIKKCDKTEKIPVEASSKTEKLESIAAKIQKLNDEKTEAVIDSTVMNNSAIKPVHSSPETNKSPSPIKRKLTKKSNLDKVIEAVSRGLLSSEENDFDKKLNGKNKSDAPIVAQAIPAIETNGIGKIDKDFKPPLSTPTSPIKQEKSPQLKIKPNKKSKKEKDKQKDRVKNKLNKDTEIVKVNGQQEISPLNDSSKKVKKEKHKKQKQHKNEESIEKPLNRSTENSTETTKPVADVKSDSLATNENNHIKDDAPIEQQPVVQNVQNDSIVVNNGKPASPTQESPTQASEPIVELKPPPILTNGTSNAQLLPPENTANGIEHKQSRKRRKEKHRNKHGSDGERSSSKEHKKKRKRKNHDMENPDSYSLSDGVPKIKIKVNFINKFHS